ncbi:MAG: Gfo/Idh/MocA family oxidoreductase [Gracilimonas sp.]|uniref:Gfo/Idh/MocA family protein n=1 Tax=Gracilimonas sp. TaxID=1974203 RepID=UPI0019B6726D|nr:Gfo/Idh/MocA family oxidoreductase [Gracilimonas sp.]MBD3616119.1 Gfo/Idh/MocA family oxidoreductase [Gracilimonas sp.]
MNKVNWGILSTADIATKHVIPGMQKGELCNIQAISSRSAERAKEAADTLNIARAYGSYEELLADEEIDAIYNPLPNHLHVPWTIKALEAGKHVLCEKSIAINAKEAERLKKETEKYPHLKVMEAFMYRFHPQWEVVKGWVDSGKIGDVKTLQTMFTYYNVNPDDIRNKEGMGGGGLLDVGCYCISASRYIFDEEPLKVMGEVDMDPDFNIDRLASGILTFSKGTSVFTCSTQAGRNQSLIVLGTEARIEMDNPFNPYTNATSVYLRNKGELLEKKTVQADHYTLQGDAFSRSIMNDEPVPTPLTDAIANLKVIDAVFESGKKQSPVHL